VAPDILDNVDFDDVASVTARIMGVPASVQSTDDEVIKARRKREANIQKMQTTARMQELAKASKDMAQAQALTSGEMQ
jgi:regulator of protease activity HflC (stomatin/prohibitin superfamily)